MMVHLVVISGLSLKNNFAKDPLEPPISNILETLNFFKKVANYRLEIIKTYILDVIKEKLISELDYQLEFSKDIELLINDYQLLLNKYSCIK